MDHDEDQYPYTCVLCNKVTVPNAALRARDFGLKKRSPSSNENDVVFCTMCNACNKSIDVTCKLCKEATASTREDAYDWFGKDEVEEALTLPNKTKKVTLTCTKCQEHEREEKKRLREQLVFRYEEIFTNEVIEELWKKHSKKGPLDTDVVCFGNLALDLLNLAHGAPEKRNHFIVVLRNGGSETLELHSRNESGQFCPEYADDNTLSALDFNRAIGDALKSYILTHSEVDTQEALLDSMRESLSRPWMLQQLILYGKDHFEKGDSAKNTNNNTIKANTKKKAKTNKSEEKKNGADGGADADADDDADGDEDFEDEDDGDEDMVETKKRAKRTPKSKSTGKTRGRKASGAAQSPAKTPTSTSKTKEAIESAVKKERRPKRAGSVGSLVTEQINGDPQTPADDDLKEGLLKSINSKNAVTYNDLVSSSNADSPTGSFVKARLFYYDNTLKAGVGLPRGSDYNGAAQLHLQLWKFQGKGIRARGPPFNSGPLFDCIREKIEKGEAEPFIEAEGDGDE